jgi:hypothetical protein
MLPRRPANEAKERAMNGKLQISVEQGSATIEHVALVVEDAHMILLHIGTREKRPRVKSYDGVTSYDAKENEQGLWLAAGDGSPVSRVSVQGDYVYSMASPDKYGVHWLLVKQWPEGVAGLPLWPKQ